MDLAKVVAAHGHHARAARLLAAATSVFDTHRYSMDEVDRTKYDQCLAHMRALLGVAAFEGAWAAGQAMPLEQAVADALEDPGAGNALCLGVKGTRPGNMSRMENEVRS